MELVGAQGRHTTLLWRETGCSSSTFLPSVLLISVLAPSQSLLDPPPPSIGSLQWHQTRAGSQCGDILPPLRTPSGIKPDLNPNVENISKPHISLFHHPATSHSAMRKDPWTLPQGDNQHQHSGWVGLVFGSFSFAPLLPDAAVFAKRLFSGSRTNSVFSRGVNYTPAEQR